MSSVSDHAAAKSASPIPGVTARVALLITVCVIAINLRAPMLSVAPLLETIRRDLGLSNVAAGMITTLPVICFGLLSPLAPALARRIGLDLTLLIAIATLAGGIAVRLGQPVLLLYLGTLLVGGGIAILNVLLPAFIKREAPDRMGIMTSIYSMLLNAGAALGAALSVPVMERAGWGWRPSLGIWLVPALIGVAAVLPWALHARRNRGLRDVLPVRGGLWGSPIAWQVTIAMGTQSMVFFGIAAWLPTMLQDEGMSEARAGAMLSLMTVAGLGGSFITPILANRRQDQVWLAPITAALCGLSIIGLIIVPTTLTFVWTLALGFGLGMALSLMLMLMILRAPDAHRTSELSGMAQGVGYLLASTGPILVGALRDITGGWTVPFTFIALLLIPFTISAMLAGRDRMVPAE
jgi:CP family cyanate transporter-like MFS transporter